LFQHLRQSYAFAERGCHLALEAGCRAARCGCCRLGDERPVFAAIEVIRIVRLPRATLVALGKDRGERKESFDKQIVRNWLAENWDKHGTPPALPAEIVAQTADRYAELVERLTSEVA